MDFFLRPPRLLDQLFIRPVVQLVHLRADLPDLLAILLRIEAGQLIYWYQVVEYQ